MLDYNVLMQSIIDNMKDKQGVGGTLIRLYVKDLQILSIEDDKVSFICVDEFRKDNLIARVYDQFAIAVAEELEIEDPEIILIPADVLRKEKEEEISRKREEKRLKEAEANRAELTVSSKYTFDSFVVGTSNRVAYETSLLVSHEPAEHYNPLFIYGPSGLGKTHLLHSIINEIRATKPNFNVVYVTCEEFTNLLIEIIAKKADTSIFRDKYRNADFLLIDDIQFLANKKVVQEEMFHTFEALYARGKQIVFASDRPPSEIENIDKRLTTRFSMGGIIDIQPPDTELRHAIFKRKAESLGVELSHTVLDFLAENIRTNIRQIEGAIRTLRAHSLIGGEPISLEMAERVLSEYLKKAERNSVDSEAILNYVAKMYSVNKTDIIGKKRDTNIKNARHVCAYLLREILGLTYKEVGEILGRHHTSIIDACNNIDSRIRENEIFRRQIAEMKHELLTQPI